jgi:hypothetical protein
VGADEKLFLARDGVKKPEVATVVAREEEAEMAFRCPPSLRWSRGSQLAAIDDLDGKGLFGGLCGNERDSSNSHQDETVSGRATTHASPPGTVDKTEKIPAVETPCNVMGDLKDEAK